MKGIVVYHSRFGNAQKIADAIGRGLTETGQDVQVMSVEDAGDPDPSLDFVVIGGSTRAARASGKIKRYAAKAIKALPGKPFATFSTGGSVYSAKTSKQASDHLFAQLNGAGLVPLATPLKAGVSQMKGPLAEGEEERAVTFGKELSEKLNA
ncbi:MAG: flavodoxin family protein [Candidatus Geothermincolia bacterium]